MHIEAEVGKALIRTTANVKPASYGGDNEMSSICSDIRQRRLKKTISNDFIFRTFMEDFFIIVYDFGISEFESFVGKDDQFNLIFRIRKSLKSKISTFCTTSKRKYFNQVLISLGKA